MFRGIIRAVAMLLVVLVIGIVVVALTGGAFWVGGGLANCPASVDQGEGLIPSMVRGGYEASVMVQAGDGVFKPAVTVTVKPATVTVGTAGCRSGIGV